MTLNEAGLELVAIIVGFGFLLALICLLAVVDAIEKERKQRQQMQEELQNLIIARTTLQHQAAQAHLAMLKTGLDEIDHDYDD